MRVHRVIVVGLAVAAGAAACSSGRADAPPATPATPAQVHGTLNEVMKSILFPNSNIIFDMQERDPGVPFDPGTGIYSTVYTGWERVSIAGIALAEAANLIALPGRVCENGRAVPLSEEEFIRTTQGLRDVGMAAYRYAQAQQWSEESAFELGDQLSVACANCHDVYRDKVVNDRMIGVEDRCER